MPAATIATIDTIALRLPLDTWAPPPQFAGKPRTPRGHAAGAGHHQRRRGRLGRGLRQQFAHDPGRVRFLDQACRHRTGCDRPRPDGAARTPAAWLRSLRSGGACDQRARHRAVGYPRQARRRAGLRAARRRRRKRVEAYASLLQYGGSSSTCAATSRGRSNAATATSSCTNEPRTRSRPPAMWPGRTSRSWSTPTAPGLRTRPTAPVAAMAPSKPFWVEEPIWPPEDFDSLAVLRARPACRSPWARMPPACSTSRK